MTEAVVLGIDPGSHVTGYGVITQEGTRLIHLASGVFRVPESKAFPDRLRFLFDRLSELFQRHTPSAVAVESVFYARNVRSVVVLAHARAVALLTASQAHVPVAEYAPMEVKRAILGNGRASKDQVASMIGRLFPAYATLGRPEHDASDALAVALCHLNQSKTEERIARSVVPTARRPV